jgi:XRE family transcriptional regulator, stress-response regulator
MILLRKVIGDILRGRRLAQHRTLREVSTAANVSLGYLSEIERGHKEASSELLSAICDALGARLSEMLVEVSQTMAVAEQMDRAVVPESAAVPATGAVPALAVPAMAGAAMSSGDTAVTEGNVMVQVHSDGPLRTTLTTKRTPPGQRHTESVFAA